MISESLVRDKWPLDYFLRSVVTEKFCLTWGSYHWPLDYNVDALLACDWKEKQTGVKIQNKQTLKFLLEINMYIYFLTLILPTPKVISLCHCIEPGQPAHPCCQTCLYTVGWPSLSFHLDVPKIIMDSDKNERRIIPFMKFGMVRVNSWSQCHNIVEIVNKYTGTWINHNSAVVSIEDVIW